MSDGQIFAALERLEARLETGLTGLDNRLTGLEARQTTFEERFSRMEETQTRLRVDLMARMDRLDNRLTEIRDDIGVNLGREHGQRAARQ